MVLHQRARVTASLNTASKTSSLRISWESPLILSVASLQCNHMIISVKQKIQAPLRLQRRPKSKLVYNENRQLLMVHRKKGRQQALIKFNLTTVSVLMDSSRNAIHFIDRRCNMSVRGLLVVLRGMLRPTNLPFGILSPDLHWLMLNLMQMPSPLYFRNQLSSNFISSGLCVFNFFTSSPSSLYSKYCRLGGLVGPPATNSRGCKRP